MIDLRSLRRGGESEYDFRMDCPHCPDGTLLINVDPALKSDAFMGDHWGISAMQCEPSCSCPLTDGEINAIEAECELRAGLL